MKPLRPHFPRTGRALLVGLACLTAACEPPESKTPAAGDVDALRSRVQAILDRHHVPGVGLAILWDDGSPGGRVWIGGVGKADVEGGRAVDGDTVFRVGSISKTFTALAALRLVEQGRLALDARLAVLAPEIAFTNPWEAERPVTLAHLLEHTAGWDDMHFNEMYDVEGRNLPLAAVLALNPRSRTSRWLPGTRTSYSNPGFGVAGYVVEKIAGRPFEDAVQAEVIAPLGMTVASFRKTPAVQERLAVGYGGGGVRAPALDIHHRPAGSLYASPREMARLVRMLLDRGRLDGREVFSAASIERMERTGTLDCEGLATNYGLGNYGTIPGGDLGLVARGHDGGIDGFLSNYRYARDVNAGWVILINESSLAAFSAGKDIEREIVQFVLQGKKRPEPPAPSPPPPPDELRAFAGYYRNVTPRNEVFSFADRLLGGAFLVWRDGALHFRPLLGAAKKLVPMGGGRFRFEGHGGAILITKREADGRRHLIAGPIGAARMEEGSGAVAVASAALFALASLCMSSALPFALVWGLRLLVRRLRGRGGLPGDLSVRAMPLLAVVTFMAAQIGLAATPLWQWGAPRPGTVMFFLGMIAFALIAPASLWVAARSFDLPPARRPNLAVRVHSLLVALSATGMALYLGMNHWVGLRLWAW